MKETFCYKVIKKFFLKKKRRKENKPTVSLKVLVKIKDN